MLGTRPAAHYSTSPEQVQGSQHLWHGAAHSKVRFSAQSWVDARSLASKSTWSLLRPTLLHPPHLPLITRRGPSQDSQREQSRLRAFEGFSPPPQPAGAPLCVRRRPRLSLPRNAARGESARAPSFPGRARAPASCPHPRAHPGLSEPQPMGEAHGHRGAELSLLSRGACEPPRPSQAPATGPPGKGTEAESPASRRGPQC